MTTLVGCDGDALRILLDSTLHDLKHAAVVAQVNDLGALALQYTAHDIDSRIMTVKKGSGGYNADLMIRLITHIALEIKVQN
jgi:hypothetical protein